MPSGMLTIKIHRQEPTVATAPPRIGASTGAARAGQVSHAMARTRSPFALDRSTRRRPTGTIRAPPTPCTTRIATSIGKDTLAIANVSDTWTPSDQGTGAALEVEDFDAAIKTLKDANVRFAAEAFETPVCHMAVVQDPDGNKLMIHKLKPS